jgi:hypothetical protein
MKSLASVVSLCLLSAPLTGAPPAGSLKVFVRAAEVKERKDVDDATKKALKAKKDAAKEARKALEKELKDKHGKKEEAWPTEVQDQLFEAREEEAIARADYEYRKIDPKGLKDSVKDVVESLAGKGMAGVKEHAQVVGSPGEADLVVEIMARRGEKTLPTQFKADTCYLLFTIAAGGEMKKDRFAKVPASYRYRSWKHAAWKLRSPKPDEPWFYFESSNGGGNEIGCHGTAANGASAVINKFIEDNYSVLKGS